MVGEDWSDGDSVVVSSSNVVGELSVMVVGEFIDWSSDDDGDNTGLRIEKFFSMVSS